MLETRYHGKVCEIQMQRGPVNAINLEFVHQLIQAFNRAIDDPECDAIVLSARKGVFSAGLDVVELATFDQPAIKQFWSQYFKLLETIACSSIPVTAAITGHSPAGGAVMCLFADYRVMSRGKYLVGLNEARVGLIIPRLLQDAMTRLVGPRKAEQMMVSGSLIGPEEALNIGLVDALEDNYEATVQRAIDWCESLISLPRKAMLGNRAIARAHYKHDFKNNSVQSVESFVDTWFSEEAQSVMKALVHQLKQKK